MVGQIMLANSLVYIKQNKKLVTIMEFEDYYGWEFFGS